MSITKKTLQEKVDELKGLIQKATNEKDAYERELKLLENDLETFDEYIRTSDLSQAPDYKARYGDGAFNRINAMNYIFTPQRKHKQQLIHNKEGEIKRTQDRIDKREKDIEDLIRSIPRLKKSAASTKPFKKSSPKKVSPKKNRRKKTRNRRRARTRSNSKRSKSLKRAKSKSRARTA